MEILTTAQVVYHVSTCGTLGDFEVTFRRGNTKNEAL